LYPPDDKRDSVNGIIIALDAEKKGGLRNHPAPAEWKISPNVLEDITNAAVRNIHIGPKDLQKGAGMDYYPMDVF